jgi:hypothetical protein
MNMILAFPLPVLVCYVNPFKNKNIDPFHLAYNELDVKT